MNIPDEMLQAASTAIASGAATATMNALVTRIRQMFGVGGSSDVGRAQLEGNLRELLAERESTPEDELIARCYKILRTAVDQDPSLVAPLQSWYDGRNKLKVVAKDRAKVAVQQQGVQNVTF